MKGNVKRAAAAALGLMMAFQAAPAVSVQAAKAPEWNTEVLNVSQIGGYESGQFNVDGGVMEIVAYNRNTGRAYAINGQSGALASISLKDLESGAFEKLEGLDIDVKGLVEAADSGFAYGDMTSVAISPDQTTLAAALQAEDYREPGRVALFSRNADRSLTLKGLAVTGMQPDMVTFANNTTVLTADVSAR